MMDSRENIILLAFINTIYSLRNSYVLKADSVEATCGPENVEGALKERLEVYRRTKVAAEAEGNTSKARRYGRICKQFEDALKMHARGKPVPLDELPVPPGFPPLVNTTQGNNAGAQVAPKPGPPGNVAAATPAQPRPPVPPPRAGRTFIELISLPRVY